MSALIGLQRRQIGAIGTVGRVVIGLVFLVGGFVGFQVVVIHGQSGSLLVELRPDFNPIGVILGVTVIPALLLGLQWLRSRRSVARFEATGIFATAVNMGIWFALVLTPIYAPQISFASASALVFYGASMLLAAVRGYAGCEVLAVSNWLLHRDDQVGCMVWSLTTGSAGRANHAPSCL
ncbi:MAG: hypothetical protein ACREOS_02870 [Candidatus Dormibacteraceae bacterium]